MLARRRQFGSWLLILAWLACSGCTSTGAPRGWLSVAQDAPTDPYGAWVTVEYVKGHPTSSLAGEFLAVDGDSLYILVPDVGDGDPIQGVCLDIVKKAKIAHFDPENGKASGWVTTGSLSTASHGLGLAVSLPVWLIAGSTMAGSHSRTPLENFPNSSWHELRTYARFPQGPPPRLHELGLRQKPLERSKPIQINHDDSQ